MEVTGGVERKEGQNKPTFCNAFLPDGRIKEPLTGRQNAAELMLAGQKVPTMPSLQYGVQFG